jgi:hypothetical protein
MTDHTKEHLEWLESRELMTHEQAVVYHRIVGVLKIVAVIILCLVVAPIVGRLLGAFATWYGQFW